MKVFQRLKFFQTGWLDFFPKTNNAVESGIHAKLNYQVIADRQTRKLSILMIAIVFFSLVLILFIWYLSTYVDAIISQKDLDSFDKWMGSIENHGITTAELEEENTKMYWMVYFIRFIGVRVFIAFTVVLLLSFLIKVYLRTRSDRTNNIQKEEALSAIHYFARGEWRYQYDDDGKAVIEGDRIQKIELIGDAALTTRELLGILPMQDLFSIPNEGKSKVSPGGDLHGKISQLIFQIEEINREMRYTNESRSSRNRGNDFMSK